MRGPIAKWLMILPLACLIGGHWALLQSIAWVGMTWQFSRTDSLSAAIKKTFDGQHPCKLCKAVQKGMKGERQQSLSTLQVKLDGIVVSGSSASGLESRLYFLPGLLEPNPSFRSEPPPYPPPRLS